MPFPILVNYYFHYNILFDKKLIPAITGGRICSDNERTLLSLPTRYGGLNTPFLHETANFEYKSSRVITKQLTNFIINQGPLYTVDSSEASKLKSNIKAENEEWGYFTDFRRIISKRSKETE